MLLGLDRFYWIMIWTLCFPSCWSLAETNLTIRNLIRWRFNGVNNMVELVRQDDEFEIFDFRIFKAFDVSLLGREGSKKLWKFFMVFTLAAFKWRTGPLEWRVRWFAPRLMMYSAEFPNFFGRHVLSLKRRLKVKI